MDFSKIEAFFASSLGQRILKSPRVLREYRFSMELPAGDVEPGLPAPLSEEPVVVQGALDCAFWEAARGSLSTIKPTASTTRMPFGAATARSFPFTGRRSPNARACRQEGVLYAFSLGRAVTGDFSAPKG